MSYLYGILSERISIGACLAAVIFILGIGMVGVRSFFIMSAAAGFAVALLLHFLHRFRNKPDITFIKI